MTAEHKEFPIRNHLSNAKNIDLSLTYIQNNNSSKPIGLWYSIGDAWYNLCKRNNYYIDKYLYELNIDNFVEYDGNAYPDKVLKLLKKDMMKFNDKYITRSNFLIGGINWVRVANDYAGIEFSDYSFTDEECANPRFPNWWATIDIPSGCIWNLKVIKSIKWNFPYRGL